MWDTSGSNRLRSITRSYLGRADFWVIAFSITNKENFDNLDSWTKEIKDHWDNKSILIVLLGTKWDLEDKREVTKEEAQEFADNNDMDYFEVSSLTGENIEEFMQYLLDYYNNSKSNINVKIINKEIKDQVENKKSRKSVIGIIKRFFA